MEIEGKEITGIAEGYTLSADDIAKHLGQYYMRYEISVAELCPYGEALRFDALGFNRYDKTIKGFEIKVSRADFLGDKKWQRYLKFCNLFYFATPKGIIKKDELPEGIGLIEFEVDYRKDDSILNDAAEKTVRDYVFIRSRMVKKAKKLEKITTENYIKVLEGIALKATYKTTNILP